jgi:hypothetical protein
VVPFENVNKQIGWLVRDTNKALKKEWEKAHGRGRKADSDQSSVASDQKGKAPVLKWKKNALRHSFISYRLADVQAAAQVALEAGNSPQIIFQHYRELVRPKDAKSWFSIAPGTGGKIVYLEPPKDGEQASAAPAKAEAAQAVAAAAPTNAASAAAV